MTAARRHRHRRALAVAALVAAAVVSGCSDDAADATGQPGGTAGTAAGAGELDEQEVAAGLARLYAGAGTGRAGTAAAEQAAVEADCFGRVLAAAVPPSALADAGLVADGEVVDQAPPLPETLARQWFAAQQACADFVEVSTRAQVAATKGRLDRAAYSSCLRRTLAPAEIEEAVVATLTARWDDPAVARLAEAQSTCSARALPPD